MDAQREICHDLNMAKRACIEKPGSDPQYLCKWTGQRNICLEVLDQGMGKGYQSRFWLYSDGGVRGFCFRDPFHRRNNSWNSAVDATPGCKVVVDESTFPMGFRKGPWKGAKNFQIVKIQALQYLMNNGFDNAAFSMLYPMILEDMHGRMTMPPDSSSAASMEQVWQSLANSLLLRRKGLRVKRTRWFYHVKGSEELCQAWGKLILFCLLAAVETRFYKSILHSPLVRQDLSHWHQDVPQDDEEKMLAAASEGSADDNDADEQDDDSADDNEAGSGQTESKMVKKGKAGVWVGWVV